MQRGEKVHIVEHTLGGDDAFKKKKKNTSWMQPTNQPTSQHCAFNLGHNLQIDYYLLLLYAVG